MSDPLTRYAEELRARRRSALVCYLTAGYPDSRVFLDIMRGIAAAGADVVEVGMPFSDPLADGPIIQRSSQFALEQGVTLDRTLELIAEAAISIPVVLFSYLNPILAGGPGVLKRAADSGAQGILITDLPLGADPEREEWLTSSPLAFVRLVAPTTPPDRIAAIARHGSGFVYLITRLGVTGVRDALPPDLAQTVARVRAMTRLPVYAGFGITRPDQAAAVARLADGVVVGSALVRAAAEGAAPALRLVSDLRRGMDGA